MLSLGIDLGTGGVRCIVTEEDGLVVDEHETSLKEINKAKRKGESEQNPLDWISALEATLDKIFSSSRNKDIRAVAIDGTSGTIVPVNKNGDFMGNALMHNDMRAHVEAIECAEIFNGKCSPTFSLPKILWMQKNLRLTDEVLYKHASDVLYSWLSGIIETPTDFTNAMKTGVDLETQKWKNHPLLNSLNLPKVIAPGQVFGNLSLNLRKKWNLDHEVLLVSGATDSNSAFYASGASQLGDWASTIGTTLAIKGLSDERISDKEGRIYCHKHPSGLWLPGGASNAGGEIVRCNFSGREQSIEKSLLASPPSINGLVYPSVRNGERMPVADKDFTPFNTIKNSCEKSFYLACLEGIAFTERMVFELVESLGGRTDGKLIALGGTTRSSLGMQIRSNLLQKTLSLPANPNSAFGSAILATAGYLNQTVSQTSETMVRFKKEIHPSSKVDESLEEKYQQFRELCFQSR